MRPENKRMTEFLRQHGIEAKVRYIFTGSLKHRWSLYNPNIRWTIELAEKLEALGFAKFHRCMIDGKEVSFEGNGGVLSICARGHNEFLEGVRK